MKSFITLIFLFYFFSGFAQADSLPGTLDNEYSYYEYDEKLSKDILIYEYSELWDIDNDSKKDIIKFTSNGGAHSYYNLKIWISSKNKWKKFPRIYIDFPHPIEIKGIEELNEYWPQFVVKDFDNDNIVEIYLNLNNNFSSVPAGFSKKILINFENNVFIVEEFNK